MTNLDKLQEFEEKARRDCLGSMDRYRLEALRETAVISQQVCLEAMDRRFTCAAAMANLYFKALHAYRVELRRVRKEESK